MNRRRLLAIVTTSTTAFAGCASSSGEKTNRVSTGGEVRKQPIDDHPPEIQFSLTNESDDSITVSANNEKPFVNFPRLTVDSGSLVLLPTTDPHIHADVASTQTDGCWRFVDADGNEIYVYHDDIDDRLTLKSGGTHRVIHRLFYDGEGSDCFPEGDYTADHTIEFDDAGGTVTFSVQVSVSDGQLSGVEVQR